VLPVHSSGSVARHSLYLLPIWDSFLLVARSLNNFWYSIGLAIRSSSLSFLWSAYTFYLTCLGTTFIAFLKFDLVSCLPLSLFINFSWHSLLILTLLLLWRCWFCVQVHFVFRYIFLFRYILCSSTFYVQVHFVLRYILCSGTFCVQVHFVFRYIFNNFCFITFYFPKFLIFYMSLVSFINGKT